MMSGIALRITPNTVAEIKLVPRRSTLARVRKGATSEQTRR